MPRRRPGRAAAAVLGLAVALGSGAAAAAEPLELQVRAAFLYNFARLVNWPPGKLAGGDAPLQTCILEQDPVGPALLEAFTGKTIDGHPLAVRRLPDASGWEDCHIAYVGSAFPELTRDVLRGLAAHGVLTVHEDPSALPDGVIRLFLVERKLRFEVNQAAAERARLRLSSRLMALASVVQVRSEHE